ncbi:MAG: SprT family zinc-dependent metalloprotease [Candidatus Gribaldobacteria bacterium]|nr:SprT family zinc-dependent metalloprotease [Candidatus Gribaldobacteria bacterium]
MVKEIEKIKFVLKNSFRAKRIRIVIHTDGRVVVVKPWGASRSEVERFVALKTSWIVRKVLFFKNFNQKKLIQNTPVDSLKHREVAREQVAQRLGYFSQFYGFYPKKFSIKNQKTRWGSCSRKQNLNFNFRIAFLPRELADYLIVHELCHLKEFNHSAKFWALVALATPGYKELSQRLKKESLRS